MKFGLSVDYYDVLETSIDAKNDFWQVQEYINKNWRNFIFSII